MSNADQIKQRELLKVQVERLYSAIVEGRTIDAENVLREAYEQSGWVKGQKDADR